MKLRFMSDLHVELHADGGRSFISSLDPSGCDVLVLAGDIADCQHMVSGLSLFCKKYPKVIYVHGNHEFYAGTRNHVNAAMRKLLGRHSNLTWLEKDVYHGPGFRILGCPLWFPDTKQARQGAGTWSDFRWIRGFQNWVYEQNQACLGFLRREMRPGDIVVTHHLPSWRSVHPKYAGSDTNCFYVNDLEELILERQPALWVHGHTHSSWDYRLGRTRVLCNPLGYLDEFITNMKFDDKLTVEVGCNLPDAAGS